VQDIASEGHGGGILWALDPVCMPVLLAVILGSALGGAARYGVSLAVARRFGTGFPWATLAVNASGSLAIGLFFGATGTGPLLLAAPGWHQLLTYGVLGGFTTFSTYSLEALSLAQRGHPGRAVLYVVGTLTVGLVAVVAGYGLAGGFAR
jgi:fluoride exporter